MKLKKKDRYVKSLRISLIAIMILMISSSYALGSHANNESLLKISDFEEPAICRGCHDQTYDEWEQSLHAKAQVDKLYLTEYEEASKDTDGLTDPFCQSCHSPISYMAGEIPVTSDIGMQGVSCDFCHTVSDTTGIGNAAYQNSPGEIKRGPYVDAVEAYHHLNEYSELHIKSEFCAMCHVVNHPLNNLSIMTTYQEWKQSSYADEGKTCQHCMMVPQNGKAAATGPDRDDVFGHIFYGGHFDYNLRRAANLTMQTRTPVEVGKEVIIQINVTNSGCGHDLPTGVVEIREVWLEVNAKDSSGKTLLQETQYYKPLLVDENGNGVGALFWRATEIVSDNRIGPKETRTEEYAFEIPADVSMPVIVNAKLLYRLAPQELADKAGIGTLPITTLAQAEMSLGGFNIFQEYTIQILIIVALIIVIIALIILRKKR